MYTTARETWEDLAASRCRQTCWAHRWVTSSRGKPVNNGAMCLATTKIGRLSEARRFQSCPSPSPGHNEHENSCISVFELMALRDGS